MDSRPVLLSSSLRWQGLWSHSHELAKALAPRKVYYYQPPVVTRAQSSHLQDHNDFATPKNVKLLGSAKRFDALGARYLVNYQKHNLITLWRLRKEIQAFITYNVYELPAFLLAKKLGIKTVFIYADEYDELTTIQAARPYLRFALKKMLRKADRVICTARVMKDNALRYRKEALYLPNAVNLEDVKHTTTKKKPGKRFVVGFLGSLESWVDWTLLAEASKKLPDVYFDIVGPGSELEAFKKATRGQDNIGFRGRVPHDDIYDILVGWDVATIAFKRNKITDAVSPVKLFEYWLVELPVIATPTTELLEFKEALALARDSAEFQRTIRELENSSRRREELAKRGHRLVQETYNWQRYARIIPEYIA